MGALSFGAKDDFVDEDEDELEDLSGGDGLGGLGAADSVLAGAKFPLPPRDGMNLGVSSSTESVSSDGRPGPPRAAPLFRVKDDSSSSMSPSSRARVKGDGVMIGGL